MKTPFLSSFCPSGFRSVVRFSPKILVPEIINWLALVVRNCIFNGHAIGCNAVSWAPAILPGSHITPQPQTAPGQAQSSPTSFVKPAPAVIISSRFGDTAKMHNHGPVRSRLKVTLIGCKMWRGLQMLAFGGVKSQPPCRIRQISSG